MIKLTIAGAAFVASAACAQTTDQGAAPAAAAQASKDPSRNTAAEDRAGQAAVAESDAQRSATLQSPVDPVTPNEQVRKDEADKACAKARAEGSTKPCAAPKTTAPSP